MQCTTHQAAFSGHTSDTRDAYKERAKCRQLTGWHERGGVFSELELLLTYERYQGGGELFVSVSKQLHATQTVRLVQMVAQGHNTCASVQRGRCGSCVQAATA